MLTLSPIELEALRLSFTVALWAVLVSLGPAILIAWLLAKKEFWGKIILDGLVHLPLVLPPVVIGYGLLVLLGRNGMIGGWLYETFGISIAFSWKGAAVAAAIMGFPLLVRALRLSIEAIDPKIETAARTLGAAPIRVFLTITLPLMVPGLITGIVLAFARALGEFGATITFVANIPGETRTLPIALYTLLQSPGNEAPALRLVILAIALAILALALSEILGRRVRRKIYGEVSP